MEIVDNRKYKKNYTFESLLIGSVFVFISPTKKISETCLKISHSEAFNLDTDTVFVVADYLMVAPIKAHIVLED